MLKPPPFDVPTAFLRADSAAVASTFRVADADGSDSRELSVWPGPLYKSCCQTESESALPWLRWGRLYVAETNVEGVQE